MARSSKFKVFRMPVGFHDAYVAALSQKAAAEAWGSGTDVFSRGEAELVTDPALMEEPLARPGEVIKRLRGTAAEQIAALGKTEKKPVKRRASTTATTTEKSSLKPKSKPTPRPSRAALDEAETELARAKERHSEELKAIAERQAALAREREKLETKPEAEVARLQSKRDKAAATYEQAMRRWRES